MTRRRRTSWLDAVPRQRDEKAPASRRLFAPRRSSAADLTSQYSSILDSRPPEFTSEYSSSSDSASSVSMTTAWTRRPARRNAPRPSASFGQPHPRQAGRSRPLAWEWYRVSQRRIDSSSPQRESVTSQTKSLDSHFACDRWRVKATPALSATHRASGPSPGPP